MGVMEPGMVVGGIRLPDQNGDLVSTWQYKQHRPLVLVLWDGAGSRLPAAFARRYADYRNLGAEILAIAHAPPDDGPYPFPVLRDADGATARRLTDELPAVLVLDAYGELFRRWTGEEARAPDQDAILEWLDFTGVQCEECGPHAENWPRRDPGI
jgi:hypothetical protein